MLVEVYWKSTQPHSSSARRSQMLLLVQLSLSIVVVVVVVAFLIEKARFKSSHVGCCGPRRQVRRRPADSRNSQPLPSQDSAAQAARADELQDKSSSADLYTGTPVAMILFRCSSLSFLLPLLKDNSQPLTKSLFALPPIDYAAL